jgi:hypothetical protein
MHWERTNRGRLVGNLGAYRGVVERSAAETTWLARVDAPDQTYQSVFEYPNMTEAQQWVEQKIEELLRTPRGEGAA